jgi:hypothetical protein
MRKPRPALGGATRKEGSQLGKGFKHGGGGSNPLNFRVVGGTAQPTVPRENDIWVNTNAEITGWAFSATEPENPTEGMVWIEIGNSSPASFNALKKNTAMMYPIAAHQYVGGAWAGVTGQTYRNGAWVAWVSTVYLFVNGDTCDAVTGGWNGNAGSDANGKYLRAGAENYATATLKPNNLIDLTYHSKLILDANFTRSTIKILDESGAEAVSMSTTNAVKREYEVDISSLSGLYSVTMTGTAGGTGGAVIILLYEARLEV